MRIVLFVLLLPITTCFATEIDSEAEFKTMITHLRGTQKNTTKNQSKLKLVRSKEKVKPDEFIDLESQYFDSVSTKASALKKRRVRSK
jgi:hypothetical protein